MNQEPVYLIEVTGRHAGGAITAETPSDILMEFREYPLTQLEAELILSEWEDEATAEEASSPEPLRITRPDNPAIPQGTAIKVTREDKGIAYTIGYRPAGTAQERPPQGLYRFFILRGAEGAGYPMQDPDAFLGPGWNRFYPLHAARKFLSELETTYKADHRTERHFLRADFKKERMDFLASAAGSQGERLVIELGPGHTLEIGYMLATTPGGG